MTAEQPDRPNKRPWFQFSLLTAIVMMLVAGGLLWLNLDNCGRPFEYSDRAFGPGTISPRLYVLADVVFYLAVLFITGLFSKWLFRQLMIAHSPVRPILIFIIGGCLYGYIGAYMNSNPYLPNGVHCAPFPPMATQFKQWAWKPSSLWLTSYVLCKVASEVDSGIWDTKSGYMFRSYSQRKRYFCFSMSLGASGGGVLGLLWAYLKNRKRLKNLMTAVTALCESLVRRQDRRRKQREASKP